MNIFYSALFKIYLVLKDKNSFPGSLHRFRSKNHHLALITIAIGITHKRRFPLFYFWATWYSISWNVLTLNYGSKQAKVVVWNDTWQSRRQTVFQSDKSKAIEMGEQISACQGVASNSYCEFVRDSHGQSIAAEISLKEERAYTTVDVQFNFGQEQLNAALQMSHCAFEK